MVVLEKCIMNEPKKKKRGSEACCCDGDAVSPSCISAHQHFMFDCPVAHVSCPCIVHRWVWHHFSPVCYSTVPLYQCSLYFHASSKLLCMFSGILVASATQRLSMRKHWTVNTWKVANIVICEMCKKRQLDGLYVCVCSISLAALSTPKFVTYSILYILF